MQLSSAQHNVHTTNPTQMQLFFSPSDVTSFVPGPADDKVERGAENEAAKADAQHAKMLRVQKGENGKMKIVSDQAASDPEVEVSMIPPPLDFMDEPGPRGVLVRPPTKVVSGQKLPTVDLEALCRRASAKGAQKLPDEPEELSVDGSLHVTPLPPPSPPLSPPASPPPPPQEALEPKSPPAVAPKPKRLPANILLKSQRPAAAAAAAVPAASVSESTSALPLLPDPQRVHMEALRKLGLLKSDEADSGPALSPRLSPQNRRSWAASPPVSPRTPPATLSYSRLVTPPPSSPVPQASPTPPSDPPVFIVPAPAGFGDTEGSSRAESELAASREASGARKSLSNTPPRGALPLIKQLTPPRNKGTRSATIERSGSGLSSYAASHEADEVSQDGGVKRSQGQLRNTRARPASLGSQQELLGSAKGGVPQVNRASGREPDLGRPLPTVQHSGNSAKLPRSQGISVLICPRSENEDQRREALRRLGLLRD